MSEQQGGADACARSAFRATADPMLQMSMLERSTSLSALLSTPVPTAHASTDPSVRAAAEIFPGHTYVPLRTRVFRAIRAALCGAVAMAGWSRAPESYEAHSRNESARLVQKQNAVGAAPARKAQPVSPETSPCPTPRCAPQAVSAAVPADMQAVLLQTRLDVPELPGLSVPLARAAAGQRALQIRMVFVAQGPSADDVFAELVRAVSRERVAEAVSSYEGKAAPGPKAERDERGLAEAARAAPRPDGNNGAGAMASLGQPAEDAARLLADGVGALSRSLGSRSTASIAALGNPVSDADAWAGDLDVFVRDLGRALPPRYAPQIARIEAQLGRVLAASRGSAPGAVRPVERGRVLRLCDRFQLLARLSSTEGDLPSDLVGILADLDAILGDMAPEADAAPSGLGSSGAVGKLSVPAAFAQSVEAALRRRIGAAQKENRATPVESSARPSQPAEPVLRAEQAPPNTHALPPLASVLGTQSRSSEWPSVEALAARTVDACAEATEDDLLAFVSSRPPALPRSRTSAAAVDTCDDVSAAASQTMISARLERLLDVADGLVASQPEHDKSVSNAEPAHGQIADDQPPAQHTLPRAASQLGFAATAALLMPGDLPALAPELGARLLRSHAAASASHRTALAVSPAELLRLAAAAAADEVALHSPASADVPHLLLLPLNGASAPARWVPPDARLRVGRFSAWLSARPLVVSRAHAEVYYDEDRGAYVLADVGSTSGTFLNGARLSAEGRPSLPAEVRPGDVVQLGRDAHGRLDAGGNVALRYRAVQLLVLLGLPLRAGALTQSEASDLVASGRLASIVGDSAGSGQVGVIETSGPYMHAEQRSGASLGAETVGSPALLASTSPALAASTYAHTLAGSHAAVPAGSVSRGHLPVRTQGEQPQGGVPSAYSLLTRQENAVSAAQPMGGVPSAYALPTRAEGSQPFAQPLGQSQAECAPTARSDIAQPVTHPHGCVPSAARIRGSSAGLIEGVNYTRGPAAEAHQPQAPCADLVSVCDAPAPRGQPVTIASLQAARRRHTVALGADELRGTSARALEPDSACGASANIRVYAEFAGPAAEHGAGLRGRGIVVIGDDLGDVLTALSPAERGDVVASYAAVFRQAAARNSGGSSRAPGGPQWEADMVDAAGETLATLRPVPHSTAAYAISVYGPEGDPPVAAARLSALSPHRILVTPQRSNLKLPEDDASHPSNHSSASLVSEGGSPAAGGAFFSVARDAASGTRLSFARRDPAARTQAPLGEAVLAPVGSVARRQSLGGAPRHRPSASDASAGPVVGVDVPRALVMDGHVSFPDEDGDDGRRVEPMLVLAMLLGVLRSVE